MVELDKGPTPDKHLHSILCLFFAVLVYVAKGSFEPDQVVLKNYAKIM